MENEKTNFNQQWQTQVCAHCDQYYKPAEMKNGLCAKCKTKQQIKHARKIQPDLFLPEQAELFN